MKLLENQRLCAVTALLTDREVSERIITGRVEAFSCKRAGEDKKLSKKLEEQYVNELASSPPAHLSSSPLGALSDATSRRLLIDLISTLNASFPDHDFSNLRPDQFTKEVGPDFVVRSINSHLADVATHAALAELWSAVDDAAKLQECDVYSYVPDLDSDPFSDGILWSFNYFFFNKHLKRIVYFTCVARSKYGYDDNYAYDDGAGSTSGVDDSLARTADLGFRIQDDIYEEEPGLYDMDDED
mmetsp:Transcript_14627/g.44324  ORF Transcript_14627/g.44324 Transcript_14627/m.44324 type:complete len:243 (-) Transcript_14627:2723-3451(-)